MPNINKVVYGNQVLIDLTNSTLSSADQLAQGITAYDRGGNLLTGTASGGGGMSVIETLDSHGGTIVEITGEVIVDGDNLGYGGGSVVGSAIVGSATAQ